MSLSEEARNRLRELVDLQPTKNSELLDAWGLESGSEVHQYLESELSDYYYRDEDSLIRPTAAAFELFDEDPARAFEGRTVELTPLQADVYDALAGPEEESESVVSVLEKLGADVDADEVRKTLRRLERRGLVVVEYRAVPTFRKAVDPSIPDVVVVED